MVSQRANMSTGLRMNASSSPSFKRKAAGTRSPSPQPVTVVSPSETEDSETPKKYLHVHRYKNTNLYGAWFNDPTIEGKKKRLFFGCHRTEYLAARAQDRAALKYKPFAVDPASIQTNFPEADYAADKELRKMLTNEEFAALIRRESRSYYTKMEPTPCLRKFMELERANGNLPDEEVVPAKRAKNITTVQEYLKGVIAKRNGSSSRRNKAKEEPESSEDRKGQVERNVCSTAAPKAGGMNRHRSVASLLLETTKQPSPVSGKTQRSPVRVTSESKPKLESTTRRVPQVAKRSVKPKPVHEKVFKLEWGAQRPRSKTPKRLAGWLAPRLDTKFKIPGTARNKVQYKLHKIKSKKNGEPSTVPTTESVPPAVALPMRTKLQGKLQKVAQIDTKTAKSAPTESPPTKSAPTSESAPTDVFEMFILAVSRVA